MLLFEFEKTGAFRYIPHVDMLRAVTRTLRRARIECGYSHGFNPHILLYFSPPLPIGTASRCEQCALDCVLSAEEFLERYNRAAPAGLKALSAAVFPYPVNPAAKVNKARYEIVLNTGKVEIKSCFAALSAAAREVLAGDLFEVSAGRDGGVKEARPLLHDIAVRAGGGAVAVDAVLSAGNRNLRADRFIEGLLKRAGLNYTGADITRVTLYQ
ncbi:radical SAM protein [Clostridia bacterium]|nr:radical SAM protein [Clostridia bacterium]